MFEVNEAHLQRELFVDLGYLSEEDRQVLDESWAGVFYRECFSRLDERPFAALYSEVGSRPNVPVNVLVGAESLKAGHGWSDAELMDNIHFNLQVRYALGLGPIGTDDFDVRTLYNFRRRVTLYMQRTGENPFDRVFAQVTDAQVVAFGLHTHQLRMDSTQIASNIRRMSGLQLAVEILRRVHRMLSEADKGRYAEALEPYLRGTSSRFMRQVRGEDLASHFQRVGELMKRLLGELEAGYAEQRTYQILKRSFAEQFRVGAGAVEALPAGEVSPGRLRSPDDPDATYRRKGDRTYEGYVTSVTETCAPENPFQLVVKVQTACNRVEDMALLAEALPEVKDRTGVETLYTDGGYCGREADEALRGEEVTQVATALRGHAPNPERLNLADYRIEAGEGGKPLEIACPGGEKACVEPGKVAERYVARFMAERCAGCDLRGKCQTKPRERSHQRVLCFSQWDTDVALRRQRSEALHRDGTNPRAAIEATVGALKHPFPEDQLPVRGLCRVAVMMIGSGFLYNVRRIHRFLVNSRGPKAPKGNEGTEKGALADPLTSSWARILRTLNRWIGPWHVPFTPALS